MAGYPSSSQPQRSARPSHQHHRQSSSSTPLFDGPTMNRQGTAYTGRTDSTLTPDDSVSIQAGHRLQQQQPQQPIVPTLPYLTPSGAASLNASQQTLMSETDEKEYRGIEADDEIRPLKEGFPTAGGPGSNGVLYGSYPNAGNGRGYQLSDIASSSMPNFQQYGPEGKYGYVPHSARRQKQQAPRKLTRRETNAAEWAKRQREVPRRAKTKKVVLTQGNFIAEYPVPTPVKNANMLSGASGGPGEFSHMRYTAASCDPDDFTAENGYTLRAATYGRQTELLVCITAYNENKMLLSRTLHGVMLNVRDMVKGQFSEFRKKASTEAGSAGEAWKRVVVSLVFDGIEPADKASLDVLATIGLYQDGVMKKSIDGKETVAHIFEYTTQLSMSAKPALVEPHPNDPNNLVPVQMILCFKQNNHKKINSHRWLFNALGRQLQPDICVLLDAGTKPGKRSLYYLWEAFHHNKHLGGACGEIHAMLGNKGKKLFNPLVAAQNFEYKVSNVLDKPNESAFGYVAVLPGAFSAYRYRAIQGRPLNQYFKGDQSFTKRGVPEMSIFAKNMFLAEDRILCFELVAKANERWVLSYVKPAKGETDVPESAAELIGQRRRWLNGSFAAGVYSLVHFGRLYRSDHGIIRLFFFHIQALFNTVQLFMSWFSLANFYLTFDIIVTLVASSLRTPAKLGDPAIVQCWSGSFIQDDDESSFDWLGEVNFVLKVIYLAFLGLQIILALGNRPKGERMLYTLSFAVYAFFALYLIFMTVVLTVKAFCPLRTGSMGVFQALINQGATFGPIFAGIAGTFGVYIISAIVYLDPWHLLHSMPQYLLIAPSFTNILNVYAFCNLHDTSWGTRGQTIDLPSAVSKSEGKGEEAMVEVIERPQEDIDLTFKATVLRAVADFEAEEEATGPNQDDQNKTFRTRFICVWLLMNAVVAIVVGQFSQDLRTRYFQAILWITFGIAAVRLVGFGWYIGGESIFRAARFIGRR